MIKIRHITEADTEAFLKLCTQLDQETKFMMLEPGERSMGVEQQRTQFVSVVAHANQTILVAETAGALVGFLAMYGGEYQRNRTTAYLVAGVQQAFSGQGIGAKLFTAAETWAKAQHIHRLELTVMTHNARAIHLYQKMGFEIEGTRQDSLCIDGIYVDEYYMAKLLNV